MKLINMTNFVLEYSNTHKATKMEFHSLARNYANFLKQPLELWMFIPCDEDGNVLEEPKSEFKYLKGSVGDDEIVKYQQAKERCLFEGFDTLYLNERISFTKNEVCFFTYLINQNKIIGGDWKTIEYLAYYSLQLTQTAIKQIGL